MILRFYSAAKLRASIPETHFVSYGDAAFHESRRRIERQAKAIGLFESVTVYTEKDKQRWFADAPEPCREVLKQPRGGGYWMWKPFAILEKLRQIRPGGCVVYADSGCTVYHSKAAALRLCQLINETRDHEIGLMRFPSRALEQYWCKGDVFEEILPAAAEVRSDQLAAGRMIVVNRASAVSQIEQWADYAWQRPELFDDSMSRASNSPLFVEHRHDQAVISLISRRDGYLSREEAVIDPAIRMTRLRR